MRLGRPDVEVRMVPFALSGLRRDNLRMPWARCLRRQLIGANADKPANHSWLVCHASEGWLATLDDFRNWLSCRAA